MEVFLTVVFMVVVAVIAVVAGVSSANTRATRLREFADRLESGTCVIPAGVFGPKFDGASVRGRRGGRKVRLAIEIVGSGDNAVTKGTYSVEVPHAAASFEISRAGTLRKLGRFLGFIKDETFGEQRLDEKYVVGYGGQSMKRLFHCGEMERLLDQLFQAMGFESIKLRGERLEVLGTHGMSSLEPRELDRVFALLEKVARLCERKPIDIKLTSARATRRFGWTDGGADVLCPYCRDTIDLQQQGEPVSACEECDTVHHTACLREAGRCVVFGCRGGGSRHAA